MKNMLFHAAFFLCSLLLLGFKSGAEDVNPDTVRVGIYVTSIHNIDFKEKEYNITFWLWLKYKNKRFNFLKNLEIPNAKSETHSFVTDTTRAGTIFLVMKVQCVMKNSWRVDKFPFDRQKLWLTVENSEFDSDSLVFVREDTSNYYCRCDNRTNYSLRGWRIDNCNILKNDSTIYASTFGYGNLQDSTKYSAYRVRIDISRDDKGWLFSKLFLGMYIAFLIAYICFYIQPVNYDSRFQLSVGALFAAIGNKYIVESSLPEYAAFTLVDKLHGLTLFFILLTIAATINSLRIVRRKKQVKATRFDMIAAQVLLVIYIICNIWFIIEANLVK